MYKCAWAEKTSFSNQSDYTLKTRRSPLRWREVDDVPSLWKLRAPRSDGPSTLTCRDSPRLLVPDVPTYEKGQLTFSDPPHTASAQSFCFPRPVLHASGGGPSTFPVRRQTWCIENKKGFRSYKSTGKYPEAWDNLKLLVFKVPSGFAFLNFLSFVSELFALLLVIRPHK